MLGCHDDGHIERGAHAPGRFRSHCGDTRQQDRQLLASIPAVGPKTAWRMRAALDMAVVVATQHNPAIQCLYQRLVARGKSKMSALRAALAFAPQLPWRAQTSNP